MDYKVSINPPCQLAEMICLQHQWHVYSGTEILNCLAQLLLSSMPGYFTRLSLLAKEDEFSNYM
eukprot:2884595-Ditylum_brightwellii.AAC.1